MSREKKIFTNEEIKYIIENWGKESAHSMKKKFNCSWYAVCKVAEEHGLELPKSNEWTDEDVKTLIELSEKNHYDEIAEIMGKTKNAIYLKAKRLGITLIQDRRKWTKDEEELLEELWGNQSICAIAKKLKRTEFSLKVKAVRMGLGPMIRNLTDKLTVYDIMDILGVSRDRIVTTWVKYGLNLKKKKVSKKTSYYVVEWEDLLIFLENNQELWDSRKVDLYMLGEETEWLVAKRKKDSLEKPLGYRLWTKEEIKCVESLFNFGKSYKEIAKEINRPESSVAKILRELGYAFCSDTFWKDEEIKYLKENYGKIKYDEIANELGRTKKAVEAKKKELGLSKKDFK